MLRLAACCLASPPALKVNDAKRMHAIYCEWTKLSIINSFKSRRNLGLQSLLGAAGLLGRMRRESGLPSNRSAAYTPPSGRTGEVNLSPLEPVA